jgi:hypothetical protein
VLREEEEEEEVSENTYWCYERELWELLLWLLSIGMVWKRGDVGVKVFFVTSWFLVSVRLLLCFVHSVVPAFKQDTVQGGRYLRCFVSRLLFWSSGWRTPVLRFVFGCVWKPVV